VLPVLLKKETGEPESRGRGARAGRDQRKRARRRKTHRAQRKKREKHTPPFLRVTGSGEENWEKSAKAGKERERSKEGIKESGSCQGEKKKIGPAISIELPGSEKVNSTSGESAKTREGELTPKDKILPNGGGENKSEQKKRMMHQVHWLFTLEN